MKENDAGREEAGRWVDGRKRVINYLRVSLTDRCNLRCIYCMPPEGIKPLPHKEILTYEEILHVVRVAVEGGIRKVRLTGGEPLVRKDVMSFIRRLAQVPGLEQVTLTTNGVLLAEYASELRDCGVSGVNVSLDSLRPERFAMITRRDAFHQVWEGLLEAERVGFRSVKLNVVAMRGINDDEILDFAGLSLERPFHVRFIEFMPVGVDNGWSDDRFISAGEIRERIQAVGSLSPLVHRPLDGPAERFMLEGGRGEIGFIAALSHHFCTLCNRLRLTPEGHLRGCLFSDYEIDLKGPLRSGASDDVLMERIQHAVETKPGWHGRLVNTPRKCTRPMSSIGG
ncbi:MAG: GTP 3',8-cyclase MoaA [Desulfobacteraceae bacterium]